MKTFILASNGSFITDNEATLLDKPISKMKLAWITTASKGVDDLTYLDNRREEMSKKGFNFTEIDIEKYKKDELYEILAKYEAIFVEGGNTFYLLKATRESSFDVIIEKLVDNGTVYIGSSAGAYIATPSIIGATWMNKNNYDTLLVSDYNALNLVPFMLYVHFNKYGVNERKIIKSKIIEVKIEVKVLKDGQGIIVKDDSISFIK